MKFEIDGNNKVDSNNFLIRSKTRRHDFRYETFVSLVRYVEKFHSNLTMPWNPVLESIKWCLCCSMTRNQVEAIADPYAEEEMAFEAEAVANGNRVISRRENLNTADDRYPRSCAQELPWMLPCATENERLWLCGPHDSSSVLGPSINGSPLPSSVISWNIRVPIFGTIFRHHRSSP